MIKIIGLLSFFYMSNIYAMQYDFSVNNIKSSRASRACLPCRAHKQKCDGKDPCDNCTNEDIACVYAKMQKRGRKPKYKPNNPELHNATMIPSFSVVKQYVNAPYEEGSFYIENNNKSEKHDDLNQKSKKAKTIKNNIVYIDITDDIKPDAENNINNNDIESVDSPPYVFGDELSKICDPWIRN